MNKFPLILFLVLPWYGLAQQLPIRGYYTQDDRLQFEFKAEDHAYAVQQDDGNVVPMSSLTIHDVTLTGEFAGWQTDIYPMKKEDSAAYRVEIPLDSLGGMDSQFAFVINDFYWVEPAMRAVNRVPAPCWLTSTGSVYTTLLYKQTVDQLMTDTLLTDETARQWLMKYATPLHTHTPAGLNSLRKFVRGKQAIGIGHDTLTTYTSRLRITQFLLAGMDYPVVAFQLDSTRAEQVWDYLDQGFAILTDDYPIEVIRVLEWSYKHPEIALMGYEREDVSASLESLIHIAAQQTDTTWQREVANLVKEVSTLLNLQQTWGLYYYDSPSYQEYVLLVLCSVRDDMPQLPMEERRVVERAVTVINRYLTNLSNLKSYYQGITQKFSPSFDWMDNSDTTLQVVAWVPNEEMSRNTPGSLGAYLSDRFQDGYLAVGVGTFRFQEEPMPPSLELQFPNFSSFEENGNSAYIIDLRQTELSPEEMQWLTRKINNHTTNFHRNLAEDFDIILLINQPEAPALLR
uniref:Uncharacterized protein n=1 Tax=Roseihalotalea indica TaxID=2867963 RepID=A0AA49GH95_9BACT|nr:hypothetical protein K4G66_19760 [Tunicatimonas sp. TK19036]